MRAPSGDHTAGEYTSLAERETRALTAGKVQHPEIAGKAVRSIFRDRAPAIRRQHHRPVRSWRPDRAQGLPLPVNPGELEAARVRCGLIDENVVRHRKHADGVPRDLDILGHRYRNVLELQAASVEWLCHQRAGAQKDQVVVRESRRHVCGQYPLTRLVRRVDVERANVHALDVGRAGAEIQKVIAVGKERGPRVNELFLGEVDLGHRRRHAPRRGHTPQRTTRSAAPTPHHDVAMTIPGTQSDDRGGGKTGHRFRWTAGCVNSPECVANDEAHVPAVGGPERRRGTLRTRQAPPFKCIEIAQP